MINLHYCLLTAFFFTLLSIPVIIRIVSKKKQFLDQPSERASHQISIPTFGGVAIFFSLLFSIIFWIDLSEYTGLRYLLSSMLIIFFIGVIDDLISLSPTKKLVGQLLAITIMIYFNDLRITSMYGVFAVHELPIWISVGLTVFTMIVITNAYNIIDGLDGLAAGVGVVISLAFGTLFYFSKQYEFALLSWALGSSLIAFLRYNFYPAKIFMGDTGSLVIGFLFSVFAVKIVDSTIAVGEFDFDTKGSALAIAILIIPLFDALRVFVIRVLNSKNPLSPDRNHIHHNLSDLGFGHRRTTLYISIVNIFFILLIIFIRDLGINYILLTILSIAIFLSRIPYWIKNKKR